MTIFEGLVLAHLLGDWLLQTEWQAENKQQSWTALSVHLLIYHAVVLGVVMLGFGLRGLPVLWVMIVLIFTHAMLDRRTILLWLMKVLRLTVKRAPERWMRIAVDQSLHLLLLGIAAVYLSHFASK